MVELVREILRVTYKVTTPLHEGSAVRPITSQRFHPLITSPGALGLQHSNFGGERHRHSELNKCQEFPG